MAELELVSGDVTSVVGDHARLLGVDRARRRHHHFRRRQVGDGGSAQRVVGARRVRERVQTHIRLEN